MENHELISFGDIPVSDLMHYGTKGMKWGIRRYQNKDGSLTAAGKKRRAKLEAELDKLGGKKSDNSDTSPKPKTANEMSDNELREAVNRLQLEKQFKQLQSELHPKKVSAGKEFVSKLGKKLGDSTAEAVGNASKTFMEKKLKEVLGVGDKKEEKKKTAYELLKDKYDMKKLEYDMDKLEMDRKALKKTGKSQEDIDAEEAKEATRLKNKVNIQKYKDQLKEYESDSDEDDEDED